ncbi:MAG: DUF2961 domain-containing protein [Phycisphaerae bacterium]
MRAAVLVAILVIVVGAAAQSPVTQADLLHRVMDLERLMGPPVGVRTGMFSSYDRASRIDEHGQYVDWDANGDRGQFIRAEADGWMVMAEMEGPGAITRIWSANPHGRIRFILDGETVIEADFAELFNGKLPPFAEPLCYVTPGGGHNCYFPIGYSHSCRVGLRESTSYYQINYVAFPTGTVVEPFRLDLSDEARAACDEVAEVFTTGLPDRLIFHDYPTYTIGNFTELAPEESFDVETSHGGGIIRALYVGLADRRLPPEPYALHRCILRIHLDREDRPAVEVPLIDFFGSGFEPRFFDSLVVGTDQWLPIQAVASSETRFMYCYFPMPFDDVARVEILNLSGKKIGLTLWARVDRTRPPANTLRFRAGFRKEDPCKVLDYLILQTTGRGRIVGCVLNVDCPRRAWWGEGDDKVWIDGEAFPSYFGTGSEDFLGDAWGLHEHKYPLQGATRTGPYGKNSAYRWMLSDSIDFHTGVRFTIENWQHGKVHDTYYSSVAYWYGDPAPAEYFPPLTLKELTPPGLRIPDSVEIEDHIRGEGWGYPMREKHAGGVEFSGGNATSISGSDPVTINLPSDRDRTVNLTLRVHARRSFESIEVREADGRVIGTALYNRESGGEYAIGVVRLAKGDNLLTVQCTPRAILDCWILEDVRSSDRGPEGENLEVAGADGVADTVEYATLPWSGGAQRSFTFDRVGATATFKLPESYADATRAVVLVVTQTPDGGRFQTLLDGQPLGRPFSCRAETPAITRVPLGVVMLKGKEHTLAFRAEQPDGAATGRRLGLDVVELPGVCSPYAQECEDLPVASATDTNETRQDIRGASADAHMWCRATAPGAAIEFQVPVAKAGRYRLTAVYTRSFDYGIVQTYVNGEKAGEPLDTYAPNIEPDLRQPLGEFDLPAGPLRLRVEVVGKSERSPGYFFGVDCIIVEPVKP